MAPMKHILIAGLVLLCVLAPGLGQEEELLAVEAAAESPQAPSEIICPVKVHITY